MEIKITNMDHVGNGIGKIDNKVIFVPKSITSDICDVRIVNEYKKYDIARINKIIEKSDKRVDSNCPYYYECGGCNISSLSYSHQLEFKVNKVKNIFKRYLDMDINPTIIDSTKKLGYRNKITYHNSNNFGLFSLDNKVINIDNCLLVSNRVNELYNLVKNEDLLHVKRVMIRECDNGLILDVDGDIKIDKFIDKCISIYVNGICKYKKCDGYICVGDIKYIVSNKSFFQINTSNISKLYDEIIQYGKFSKKDSVIDLYCGVGSIGLYISKYVDSVLGIEIIPEAIMDANKNAKINGIDNVKFLCGDVSKLFDDKIDGDILIVDPPRTGLDKHTISIINNSKIKKIIYVSCDAMALARDLGLLNNYSVKGVSVVDMFPQTHHVECVALLSIKILEK